MGKVVFVDKDECTSCQLCALTLPDHFRMDDDDMAETHITGDNVNEAPLDLEKKGYIQDTMDDCPGDCIMVRHETGEVNRVIDDPSA